MGSRKYGLDWLRVAAFAFLILFHAGLLYSTWSYNLKSPRLVPGIEWGLMALYPWRMALLFLISGVASRFLIATLGAGRFALDRFLRLQPVIMLGMFVIIPPQTYVLLLDRGVIQPGYLDFWLGHYLAFDQTLVAPLGRTMPTWDHLWFLVYLLAYVMIFALVFALTGGRGRRLSVRPPLPVLLIAPAVWMALTNWLIETVWPLNHGFVSDWGAHLKWGGLFAFGVLWASCDEVWAWLAGHWRSSLAVAFLLLAIQWALQTRQAADEVDPVLWSAVTAAYGWAMICTLCGLAMRWLNRPSALLSHLNEAILPIYVLHQPILLVAAYLLFPLRLPLAAEAGLLLAAAGLGSLLIYEVAVRPFPPMRFLFGLKNSPTRVTSSVSASSPLQEKGDHR